MAGRVRSVRTRRKKSTRSINNAERLRRKRDARYRSKYGVSLDHLEALMVKQQHKCAICGKSLTARMNLDHDHATGRIRGLLCPCCNRGLGLFGDSLAVLTKAVQYLKQYGA